MLFILFSTLTSLKNKKLSKKTLVNELLKISIVIKTFYLGIFLSRIRYDKTVSMVG